jgi:hypothetical protein
MSDRFRVLSPEAPELQPIIEGLFAEYAARYGNYFSRDAEVELTEWYLPPQGLFIVLERNGEIIATGAYKPFDASTAEIKRIWTHSALRQQGLAARVDNLFDREYVGSVIVNESNGRYYEPAPGRNYGVGLSVAWQF